MLEKHEVCCAMFHGFDWSVWTTGTPADRLTIIPAAQDHILEPEGDVHSTDGEGIGDPQRHGEEVHRRRESADAGNPGNSSGTSI